jgi:prepilin-type N-terminal cleavage/methylation domain-containing protein
MNPRRSQKGFTLVEALVVSVLMAILAAVAIPMYSGYVNSQRIQNVKNLAQTAAVSANSLNRKGVVPTAELVKATMYLPDPNAYTVAVDNGAKTVTVTDAAHNSITATSPY